MSQPIHIGSAVHGSGPTGQEYNTTNAPLPPGGGATHGTLPFTGAELGLPLMVAAALVAAGSWMRRRLRADA